VKKNLRFIQAVILSVAALAYVGAKYIATPKAAAAGDESYYVLRVVDGDTLKLSGGERVRLIGIDTPEVFYSSKLSRDAKNSGSDTATIQKMGKEASDFTKKLCSGKMVRLEYDVQRRDKYDRLLAYVYLEDGTFVNARIIEEGYAQVMTVVPNVKYAELFLRLQKDARDAHRGLWR
jgi:micrococcal nuclease